MQVRVKLLIMVQDKLGIVFRGIVDNNHFKRRIALTEQRSEIMLQVIALVLSAHNYRYAGLLIVRWFLLHQLQSRFTSCFLGSLQRFARLSLLPFGVPAKTLFLLMPYAPLYARHVTYVEIQLIHEHQR